MKAIGRYDRGILNYRFVPKGRCSNVGGYAQRIQVKSGLLYVQYLHAIRQGRFPNRNGLLSATKKENVEKANLD